MKPELQQLKALAVSCGLSEDASEKLVTTIDEHNTKYKQKLDEDYQQRLEAARKIVVEECENQKAEMARRVQIFCEARAAQIEQIVAKQHAQRESEAVSALTSIQTMLAGYPVNGDAGLKESNEKLTKQLRALQEEHKKAVTVANRQTGICEKVLKRNRALEGECITLREQAARAAQPINENRDQPDQRQRQTQQTQQRPGQPVQRLDASRRTATPRTTRATMVENQDRRPPVDDRRSHITQGDMPETPNGMPTPKSIAESIDELP